MKRTGSGGNPAVLGVAGDRAAHVVTQLLQAVDVVAGEGATLGLDVYAVDTERGGQRQYTTRTWD